MVAGTAVVSVSRQVAVDFVVGPTAAVERVKNNQHKQ